MQNVECRIMNKIDKRDNAECRMQNVELGMTDADNNSTFLNPHSKLGKLIQQYCPDGVEWKTFFDVCDYVRGITYNKSQEAKTPNGNAHKVLRANNITLHRNTLNFDDVKLVSTDVVVKPNQHLYEGDILMCAGSGSKEHVGKVAYIFQNMDYTFGGFMAVVRCKETIHPRYMFHILTSDYFSNHLDVQINSSTINNINNQVMQSFAFPLPPLPVQEEIVNILDRFAVYAAELQAELQARQQQYNYYRDTLLSFEGREDVQWKKLGEVCDIRRGIRVVKKQLNDNGAYPVFQNSIPPMGYYDQCNREGNMPYVICAGSSSGSIGYCSSPFWAADDCFTVEGTQVNNRYAFHTLKKNNHKLFSQVRNGSMPRLPHDAIDNLIIPIPSLEEQEKIADILDRFDHLTNDLSQGLPAEIEARQQQYEYYRDQLLTFKRKEV